MAMLKRVIQLLALCLGFAGAIACVAATVVAWNTGARLCRAADRLFEKLEGTVGVVQTRVVQIRHDLDESKLATGSIAEGLKDWTKREVRERAATRIDLEKKTERLASMLQETDRWLEHSESAVGLVERGLSIGAAAGGAAESTNIDRINDAIMSLRDKLAEATDAVARIRDWMTGTSDAKPGDRRLERGLELAARLAATVGAIDARMDKLTDRLSQAEEDLRESNAKTVERIRLATIVALAIIVWIGAGQITLLLYGCRGLRRRQPTG
jgi:hypothetical protein